MYRDVCICIHEMHISANIYITTIYDPIIMLATIDTGIDFTNSCTHLLCLLTYCPMPIRFNIKSYLKTLIQPLIINTVDW